MYKFKAGDWVTIKTFQDHKFQLTEKEVEYSEILLGDCRFGIEDWELLQPKESALKPISATKKTRFKSKRSLADEKHNGV